MGRPGAAFFVLLALLAQTTGCGIVSAIAYYLRPPQIQKPEYEFAEGTRVAILIEAGQPREENPVFNEALHGRVVAMLKEGEALASVSPLRDVIELRRANPDFKKWSLQKVGRKLQVDEVLYIKIDRLEIRPTPDYPILAPAVDLHVKLIGVSHPSAHARLWPEAKEGHPVSCSRQSVEAVDTNPDAIDVEARKLGHDTAYWVTMPFVEVDLEEKPPVER